MEAITTQMLAGKTMLFIMIPAESKIIFAGALPGAGPPDRVNPGRVLRGLLLLRLRARGTALVSHNMLIK